MALPLSPIPQGGFLMNALSNRNALMNQEYQNQIAQAQAQYAPLTSLSDAMSKIAYANLMGPQFLAKLMGNKEILASMNQPQNAVNTLQNVAMGGGINNANPLNQAIQNEFLKLQRNQNQGAFGNSPIGQLLGGIGQLFGIGGQQQQVQPQGNAMLQTPQQQMPVTQQPPQTTVSAPVDNNTGGVNSGMQFDTKGNNVVASSEVQDAEQQRATPKEDTPKSMATRTGEFLGNEKQGEELGKVRANAIESLGNRYQTDVNQEIPLQNIVSTLTSPDFQQLRNFPFYQDRQLSAYAKIGNPTQQKMIGDFLTSLETAVSQAVGGFQTGALDRTVQMAQRMKISPDDTYNVALGKAHALLYYNKLDQQLTRRASYYIDHDKMNPGDAYEKALKQVNPKLIKERIEDMINPPVTEEQLNENAKHYGITREQAAERAKKKGYRLEIELKGEK